MGASVPLIPGQKHEPVPFLVKAAWFILITPFICAIPAAIWQSTRTARVEGTIVATYTTEGSFLTSGQAFTVFDTPKGRIIERGIWGQVGDKLTITVYGTDQ